MKVGRVFLSGCAVYVIVAACSAMDPGQLGGGGGGATLAHVTGGGGAAASYGHGAVTGSGGAGGIQDPIPSAAADPTPGARLKPVFIEADDGARSWVQGIWYDSQLDVYCSQYARACLPIYDLGPALGARSNAAVIDGIRFVDASCSTPVAYTSRYDVETPKVIVGLSQTFYEAGPAHVGQVYIMMGASCAPESDGSARKYYAVGPQLTSSSFVGMTLRVER